MGQRLLGVLFFLFLAALVATQACGQSLPQRQRIVPEAASQEGFPIVMCLNSSSIRKLYPRKVIPDGELCLPPKVFIPLLNKRIQFLLEQQNPPLVA